MLKNIIFCFVLAAIGAAAITTGNAAEANLASQTSIERGVKVNVTPGNLSSTAKTWDFEVILETHAQDLNEDMARTSTLIASGKQYRPIGWKGASPGGHHRKGSLHFNAINPLPPSVKLQIRLTGEATPRGFQWFLNGASNEK